MKMCYDLIEKIHNHVPANPLQTEFLLNVLINIIKLKIQKKKIKQRRI